MTDIEGSTALWDADGASMAEALERHDTVIASIVDHHGGTVLKAKGEGDATLSVFRRASDAARSTLDLQRALAAEAWAGQLLLRVRMALHTGEAYERGGDYFGPTLNRAARLRALAAGGQVFCSGATAELIHDRLPTGARLIDLGFRVLRGVSRPEPVFSLWAPDLGPAPVPFGDAPTEVGSVSLGVPVALAADPGGCLCGSRGGVGPA